MTVLVAVNASEPSLGAALWGAREAGRLRLPLQLVCATPYPAASGAPEAAYLEPRHRQQLESIAQEVRQDVDVLPPRFVPAHR